VDKGSVPSALGSLGNPGLFKGAVRSRGASTGANTLTLADYNIGNTSWQDMSSTSYSLTSALKYNEKN